MQGTSASWQGPLHPDQSGCKWVHNVGLGNTRFGLVMVRPGLACVWLVLALRRGQATSYTKARPEQDQARLDQGQAKPEQGQAWVSPGIPRPPKARFVILAVLVILQ